MIRSLTYLLLILSVTWGAIRLGLVVGVTDEVLSPGLWRQHQLLQRALGETHQLHNDWRKLQQLATAEVIDARGALQRQTALQRIRERNQDCSAPTQHACNALTTAAARLQGGALGPDAQAEIAHLLETARQEINVLLGTP